MSNRPLCLLDDAIALPAAERMRLAAAFELASLQAADAAQRETALAVLLHSRLPVEAQRGLGACRYLGVRAHNTDYVDVALAQAMGVTVGNIPQCGLESVAEHTLALMLGLSHQLRALHAATVAGQWRSGAPLLRQLSGAMLGIVGYGQIGRRVAELATALGMRVVIADLGRGQPGRIPLEALLPQVDVLSLHARSTGDVLLDAHQLALLPAHALLINTARGSLLDYDAVGTMLAEGRIGGVGLDVYPQEPPALPWLDHPRVLCTPHLAFHTDSTLDAMNTALIDAALAWVATR